MIREKRGNDDEVERVTDNRKNTIKVLKLRRD